MGMAVEAAAVAMMKAAATVVVDTSASAWEEWQVLGPE